jgi:hypothetical protein
MSPEAQIIILHNFIEREIITKMTAWDAQLETCFRAMKAEEAFADWLAERENVHHNNYRELFEAGALDLPMEFLAKCDIAPKTIGDLASRTHIPIETMRD